MSNYLLGSHNSWTYHKPMKWWLRPFTFIGKCQSLSIREQYELGVRVFDLRLKFKDKDEAPIISHGFIDYCSLRDVYPDLRWLNTKTDAYVRVILEHEKWNEDIRKGFEIYCAMLDCKYQQIAFFGGLPKRTNEVLYNFVENDLTIDHFYSSTTSPFKNGKLRWIDDLWPWLYAKMHNKKSYEMGTDRDCMLLDFVEIK